MQAKDFAINLPGGELLIEEQDDIIQMLETLRDHKRYASIHSSFLQWVYTLSFSELNWHSSRRGRLRLPLPLITSKWKSILSRQHPTVAMTERLDSITMLWSHNPDIIDIIASLTRLFHA